MTIAGIVSPLQTRFQLRRCSGPPRRRAPRVPAPYAAALLNPLPQSSPLAAQPVAEDSSSETETTAQPTRYGAKLTNIFSNEFVVETADTSVGKYYAQASKPIPHHHVLYIAATSYRVCCSILIDIRSPPDGINSQGCENPPGGAVARGGLNPWKSAQLRER